MCAICEGWTEEELLADLHKKKTLYGFTMSGVEGPTGWAYTIGLTEAADHPELILVGVDDEVTEAVLSIVACRILDGERFEPGDEVIIGGHRFRVGAVHPNRWADDTFNLWHDYYDVYGDRPEPAAVQLLPPPTMFCKCHANSAERHRLDLPVRLVSAGPNRAERRRAKRRGPGRQR